MERTVELLEVSPPGGRTGHRARGGIRKPHGPKTLRGEPALFLAPLYRAEVGVAGHLRRLLKGSPPWGVIDGDRALPWVEALTGLSLSPSQREAVDTVLKGKVTVLTGGPGVGKTTIVKSILKLVERRSAKVLLCAPTGRAAKRLSESAHAEARTIHRLLEFDPRHGGFRKDEADPLDVDLLIVDEVSMVDILLMNAASEGRAFPRGGAAGGRCGPAPFRGPGGGVAGHHRVRTGARRCASRRSSGQAASSSIVVNAHRINAGQPIETPDGPELQDFYFIPGGISRGDLRQALSGGHRTHSQAIRHESHHPGHPGADAHEPR